MTTFYCRLDMSERCCCKNRIVLTATTSAGTAGTHAPGWGTAASLRDSQVSQCSTSNSQSGIHWLHAATNRSGFNPAVQGGPYFPHSGRASQDWGRTGTAAGSPSGTRASCTAPPRHGSGPRAWTEPGCHREPPRAQAGCRTSRCRKSAERGISVRLPFESYALF